MAYALPEKQREYQRQWSAKKAALKPKEPNLNRNFITWEELQYGGLDIDSIRSWKNCVSTARTYINNRKTNRMAIAELATRACVIKWGGKRKGKELSTKTLAEFAKELDIHRKTLWDWVQIKRLVVDQLPNKKEGIDLAAARMLVDNYGSALRTADVPKLYLDLTSKPAAFRAGLFAVRYLKNVEGYLRLHGTSHLTKKDLETMRECLSKISDFLAR